MNAMLDPRIVAVSTHPPRPRARFSLLERFTRSSLLENLIAIGRVAVPREPGRGGEDKEGG
jgi:hypothetical protein